MKIALLGSSGMLGFKVAQAFGAKGHEFLTPKSSEVNLNYPHTLEKFFDDNSFDILINCGGFTRVDACEEPAKFSMAMNVNGTSAGWLAKFCKKKSRTLVYFSTDYVFDGEKGEPYREDDRPSPVNTYGRTKLRAEKLIQTEKPFYYLIRASWFFGPRGNHFVDTIIGLLKKKSRIEVVNDQVGGPTYTGDLALFTLELLEKKAEPGIYHFSNEGTTSWFDFAREIQKQTGLSSCEISPVLSENVFRPARRPTDSRLDLSKSMEAVGHSFRKWQEALGDYLSKEFKNETV